MLTMTRFSRFKVRYLITPLSADASRVQVSETVQPVNWAASHRKVEVDELAGYTYRKQFPDGEWAKVKIMQNVINREFAMLTMT
ncbi:hypothetical protein ACI3PM_17920, partial [Lactiplantibacillus plantarum]